MGKCKISIDKNKEKQVVGFWLSVFGCRFLVIGFWLSVFGYELLIGATILPTTKYQQPITIIFLFVDILSMISNSLATCEG